MLFLRVSTKPCAKRKRCESSLSRASIPFGIGREPATEMKRSEIEVRTAVRRQYTGENP